MQLAGDEQLLYLRCGGWLGEAIRGKGDDVDLSTTTGAPGKSGFCTANDQKGVSFDGDFGCSLIGRLPKKRSTSKIYRR
jgi:hypothetical protein